MIELKNITKAFDKVKVLDQLDLHLQKNEIVALLGSNGAGKSTLLRCMSLLNYPDQGEIRLFDHNFSFPSETELDDSIYPDITLVFQQFHLWPHLKVIDNLKLPLQLRFPDLYQQKLESIIDRFELDFLLQKFPNEISVGQKQKVALARAISLEPRILLLDEITSALDSLQAFSMANILKEERDKKTLIILVTHSINFAANCADRYLVLEDGKIAENEPIEKIYTPNSKFLKESLTQNGFLL